MQSIYFKKTEEILKFIETNPQSTLNELSNYFSISPTYLQKIFKQFFGISPKEYANMFKINSFKKLLEKDINITTAIYAAGYESCSQIYENTYQILGMTPLQYQNKKFNHIIMLALGECSLGSFLIAQTEKGICTINLGDSPEFLIENIQKQFPKALFIAADENFESTIQMIISLIENPKNQRICNLPLDIQGTIFQQKVWKALSNIPMGSTASYSEIAKIIGLPHSTRAVAKACATNNIALLVPCHRVIKKDGNLSGYRWGIERKKIILDREKGA